MDEKDDFIEMGNMRNEARRRSPPAVNNPLDTTSKASEPSDAYLESMRIARSSENYSHNAYERTTNPTLGIRTLLTSILLFFGGLIIFCCGAAFYWETSGDETKKTQGFDLLLAGSVMLVPGTWSMTLIYGAWRGWRGYQYSDVPSLD